MLAHFLNIFNQCSNRIIDNVPENRRSKANHPHALFDFLLFFLNYNSQLKGKRKSPVSIETKVFLLAVKTYHGGHKL